MRRMGSRLGVAAAAAAACLAPVTNAGALEPADLTPLLSQIPSDVFSYTNQGVDAEGRVYLDGVRANIPGFGIVSADRLSLGDIDLDGMLIGAEPTFADLRIEGLRLSRNTYLAPAPWLFRADVLTGDIAFSYAYNDGDPASFEGSLDIDFGENGRISGAMLLAQPVWYSQSSATTEPLSPDDPDMTEEQRDAFDAIQSAHRPKFMSRVLPRGVSLHVSGFAVDGDALAGLSEGQWPGDDITLALDFDLSGSDADDGLAITASIDSNLAQARLSAGGDYSARMRDAMNAGDGDSASLIEWTDASLSYEDRGLADAVLAITMAAEREPAIVVLADVLEDLSRSARELQEDGPAQDFLRTVRRVLLNYGTYAGDRASISVRPVAPVSFEMLGDLQVDPEHGLHPDDMFGLLRLRYSYQSR